MSSDLIITSPTQLPSISEMGDCESNYIQVNAQRQITGTNFNAGVIDFSFSLAGNLRSSLKKSYVRLRASIHSTGTTQPTKQEKIAFAENFANNLFQSAYFYIGGVDVSSKQNFCAQSSMARTRLSKPYSWMKSTGEVHGFNASFEERVSEVSSGGATRSAFEAASGITKEGAADAITIAIATSGVATVSAAGLSEALVVGDVVQVDGVDYTVSVYTSVNEFTVANKPAVAVVASTDWGKVVTPVYIAAPEDGSNDIEILFQPGGLGIWHTDSVLPSGQYRLSLYPVNNSKLTEGIQSATSSATANIVVEDMYLYLHTFRAEAPMVDGQYFLDLDELSVQTKTLADSGQNTFNCTIPANTYGIAVWSQGKDAGTTTELPPSIFNNTSGSLTDLKNLQLTYGGKTSPNTDFSSSLANNQNWLKQRYYDSHLYANLAEVGGETYEDWIRRGPLFYFNFVKEESNRSTELQTSIRYGGTIGANNQVFFAALYRNLCEITVSSGYVSSVRKLMI